MAAEMTDHRLIETVAAGVARAVESRDLDVLRAVHSPGAPIWQNTGRHAGR